MSLPQKLILAGLALAMLVTAIMTWGSIGSAAMVFCLIMMAAALLFQRFLTNNESNDYDMEQ